MDIILHPELISALIEEVAVLAEHPVGLRSAAGLAALMQERRAMAGRRVGVVLSGGNVSREQLARVLAGAGADG